MEGKPAFLVRERIAPVAVREGLAKHYTYIPGVQKHLVNWTFPSVFGFFIP